MYYNVLIADSNGKFNIIGLTKNKLDKLVDSYLQGSKSLTLTGKTYYFEDINELRIFTHEEKISPTKSADYYLNNINYRIKTKVNRYLPVSTLRIMGKEVTEVFIGDSGYGSQKAYSAHSESETEYYISAERITALNEISVKSFDLTRLICLCNELNFNFQAGNYLSVGMLARTIMNHVPPIFNKPNFNEVANNVGSKSFKGSMKFLNDSMKHIADGILHEHIRTKESLPTKEQVDFRASFDVLLSEVLRILNSPEEITVHKKSEGIKAISPEDRSEEKIKLHCEKEWPDDYNMRVNCIREQTAAAAKMGEKRPRDIPEGVYKKIIKKAIKEWPDDYVMRVHTRDEEIRAYRELNRL